MTIEPHVEPQERVERGDGVLVVVRQRVTRLDTGAVDERRVGHLYTSRDDKAICMRVYADLEEAVRALDV